MLVRNAIQRRLFVVLVVLSVFVVLFIFVVLFVVFPELLSLALVVLVLPVELFESLLLLPIESFPFAGILSALAVS